jgi:hypothetical protein
MDKKHLIGYPVATILALAIGAAGASGSSTTTDVAPPAPVTKTVTVTKTQAPAECGTALDLMSKFAAAVSAEHQAMGAAFTTASQDGDVVAMASTITHAVKALNVKTSALTPRVSAAGQVCRAAIK